MPRKSLIIVTGDKELDEDLRVLATTARTRICNNAIKKGLQLLVKAEEILAPKRTGLLSRCLGERMVKRSRGFGGKAGINVGKRTGDIKNRGPNFQGGPGLGGAPHGYLVALGTHPRVRKRIGGKFAYLEPNPRSRSTGTMPADNFIRLAATATEPQVKVVIKTAITKGIAAEVKRWGKKHGGEGYPGIS